MNHDAYTDGYIENILSTVNNIALVGASNKSHRASNSVLNYLMSTGYRVFPVNPALAGGEISGNMVFSELSEITHSIDMIDIFRKPQAVYGVVEQALQLAPLPKVIWMQLGVVDKKAARLAEESGIDVVMDLCPAIEIPRLGLHKPVQ